VVHLQPGLCRHARRHLVQCPGALQPGLPTAGFALVPVGGGTYDRAPLCGADTHPWAFYSVSRLRWPQWFKRVLFAAAGGGGLHQPLVRQAKLGVSYRVKAPAKKGLTSHSYRVLQLLRRLIPNKTIEAYTGNDVGHREDRTVWSLIKPRYLCRQRKLSKSRWRWLLRFAQDKLNGPEANTERANWWVLRGSAGVHFRAWHVSREASRTLRRLRAGLGDPKCS